MYGSNGRVEVKILYWGKLQEINKITRDVQNKNDRSWTVKEQGWSRSCKLKCFEQSLRYEDKHKKDESMQYFKGLFGWAVAMKKAVVDCELWKKPLWAVNC
jgi:hypothetical protein